MLGSSLWSISFLPMTAGPAIDLTQIKAKAFFHYDTPTSDLTTTPFRLG